MRISWKSSILGSARRFVLEERGVILTETLIVVPVVTIFAIGILEFGNVFWQRHQVQVGVRDAVRYVARCSPAFNPCSEDTARNLAFYGTPDGSGVLRVAGWPGSQDENDALEISQGPQQVQVVGRHNYSGSPLMSLIRLDTFTFTYVHNQRYIGW